jgi:hypothetical protein
MNKLRLTSRASSFLFAFTTAVSVCRGTPGDLDPSFDPNADSPVWTLAVRPDGKMLVGGDFQTIAGQSRSRFTLLNPDGTVDGGFVSPALNSRPYSSVFRPGGKILLGGYFSLVNNVARPGLVQLNPDGSVDPSFTLSWVAASRVWAASRGRDSPA